MTRKSTGEYVVHPAISQDVIDRLRVWTRSKEIDAFGRKRQLELCLQGRQSWDEITVNQALDRLLTEAGF